MRGIKLLTTYFLLTLFIFSCKNNDNSDLFCKSSDNLNICHSKYGEGKDLILFVHGWSCDKSYWKNQLDYFSKDFLVVTIDLGGHGKSGTDRNNWTISTFGNDVNAVLNQYDFNKAYLVGHSMGSDVILKAASKLDNNNIELILVDRFNDTPQPWVGESFEKFYNPFKENFKEYTYNWVKNVMFIPESDTQLIEWIAKDMSDADPNVALPALRDLFKNIYLPIIKDLGKRGIQMTILNSDYQENKIENLKNSGFKVVVNSNSGHFLMMEQSEMFNKTLENIIKNN